MGQVSLLDGSNVLGMGDNIGIVQTNKHKMESSHSSGIESFLKQKGIFHACIFRGIREFHVH